MAVVLLLTKPTRTRSHHRHDGVDGVVLPSSNYGFDQIRETLDRNVVATATGLANMGGFTAGMIAAQLFGILLDKHSGGQAFQWDDFRYAALAVLVVWTIGLVGILATRGGTRPRRIRMETVTED